MKKSGGARKRGFTLIELMIVVAIIGILAAIAGPTFQIYRLRAKSSEAKILLGAIRASQESFFAEHDNYADITTQTPAPGVSQLAAEWQINDCPTTCGRATTDDCNTFECVGFRPTAVVYYRYMSLRRVTSNGGGASVTGEYGIGAIGDLDGDTQVSSFGYRSANDPAAGGVGAVHDGITACPTDIAAGEVVFCTPAIF